MRIKKPVLILSVCALLFLSGCSYDNERALEKKDLDDRIVKINNTNAQTKREPTAPLADTKKESIKSYEIRPDGAMRITDIFSAQNGAFSQDSKKIVFTQFKSGYNEGEADLKILDLETDAVDDLLSDGNSNVNLPGSSWIGDEIVFSSTKSPHDEIYMINAKSKMIIQLTSRKNHVAYEPSFSPDKEQIVFESHKIDVEDNGIIMIYNIKDGAYTEITDKNEDNRQPNWSPRGDLIIYQKSTEGQWDIWVYNLSSETESRLTSSIGDKTDASFSPDGQWVIYSSSERDEGMANVYAQTIDGRQKKRITNQAGYDGAPSWSYDNKYVVFESTPGEPDGSDGSSLWIIRSGT